MSWTVRPAAPGDAAAMAETVRIGFDGYRAFGGPGWLPPDALAPDEIARLRVRLELPGTWAVVAEEDGRAAGHAGFFPQPGVAGSAHLWQLFVRPPWWGSGLAADLLDRAVEAARAEGYARMRLFTPRDQARARAFYEREGFAWTGWEAYEEPLRLVLVEYARDPLG